MPDFITGLPTELFGNWAGRIIDFVASEITGDLAWKVKKKELQLSANHSDFLDRYAEAFISIKGKGKPKPTLEFYARDIVIESIYQFWQGSYNEDKFIQEFGHWAHYFSLTQEISNFNAGEESTTFLQGLKEAVHANRTAGESQMFQMLEHLEARIEKLLGEIATGNHFTRIDLFDKVFIFCNKRDRQWVQRELVEKLSEADISFYFDPRTYQASDFPWWEKIVSQCRKTLVIFSGHFSEYEKYLVEGYRLDKRTELYHEKLLVLHTDINRPLFEEAPSAVFDFTNASRSATELIRLIKLLQTEFDKPFAPPAFPPLTDELIEIPNLLLGGENAHLFDRQTELKMLDEAWEKHDCHIFCLVANGGVGKTALVSRWLADMAKDNYRGAGRVFVTSFYSQGTSDRVTSADAFIHKALTWFGEKGFEQKSAWDKGKRLAELVNQHKTLLVLDGLEPLQYGGHVETGKIKDPALHVLLKELAKNNGGLCLITTRQTLSGLERYASTIRAEDLEHISDAAGKHILRQKNIAGTDGALVNTLRNFGNHALAVNLLSAWLYNFPGHPITNAKEIPDLPNVLPEKGKHPRRVIAAFEVWLKENGHIDAVRLLHLMGLFDKPISEEILKQVFEADKLPAALKVLRRQKLLYDVSEREYLSEEVDCHPLIREHFQDYLQTCEPELYSSGHERLYEYYKALPEKHLPDTLEEMEPLFWAIAHGSRAGLYEEALSEIYFDRIQRDANTNYCSQNLGAISSDLSVLSNFFDEMWDKPSIMMNDIGKMAVLGWAGFRLQALGRHQEAYLPYYIALHMRIEERSWGNASLGASNLCRLCLEIGLIEEALKYGQLCVEYGDLSQNVRHQVTRRAILGNVFHQAGELLKAEELFKEAEQKQQSIPQEYPYLYSLRGYDYCDLLLNLGRIDEVVKRAKTLMAGAKKYGSLLDIATNILALGRAYFLKYVDKNICSEETGDLLNEAVMGLRKSGYNTYLPHGLLARASWHIYEGRYAEAHEDLVEVLEIAEGGGMRLYLVDYHIEMSRMRAAEEQLKEAAQHKAEALRRIKETGYLRRLKEAEEL